MKSYDLDQDTDNFLSLYGIICMYIFLIIAIIIGGGSSSFLLLFFSSNVLFLFSLGGIAVCIVYYSKFVSFLSLII